MQVHRLPPSLSKLHADQQQEPACAQADYVFLTAQVLPCTAACSKTGQRSLLTQAALKQQRWMSLLLPRQRCQGLETHPAYTPGSKVRVALV